jgi:hypothetical protein
MSTQNVTRGQIMPLMAYTFNTGIFIEMTGSHMAKGSVGLASLDLAAVVVSAAAAVIIATKLYRALPASA